MMIYCLGIFISTAAGFLLLELLTQKRLHLTLHLSLALALGFGLDGTVAFYTHILSNQNNHAFPIALMLLGIGTLIFFKKNVHMKKIVPIPNTIDTKQAWRALSALGIIAIPLSISAHYYPLGGWDAWSCWNLKAKFIFLSSDHWQDIFAPGLWRSNTHYPLLWPLINVWFWDLGGRFNQAVPMLNSVVFGLLTASILLFGLLELTGKFWLAVASAILISTLPLNITLYTSQYSDALLGLFLLSAWICMLLSEKYQLPRLKIVSVLLLALMTFTKNEGLILGGITALCVLGDSLTRKKELKTLVLALSVALIPTIIFTFFMAPKNEAFINGLTSSIKPTDLSRLSLILIYPWFECLSNKWNGLWILSMAGILLAGKILWQSTLKWIGLSLIGYLSVVMGYYAVNTFFEIGWWLQTTLSRILFALIPTIVLWIVVGINKRISSTVQNTPDNHTKTRELNPRH